MIARRAAFGVKKKLTALLAPRRQNKQNKIFILMQTMQQMRERIARLKRGAARPGGREGPGRPPPRRRDLPASPTPGARGSRCPAPLAGLRGPGAPCSRAPLGHQAGQAGARARRRPRAQAAGQGLPQALNAPRAGLQGPESPPCFLLSPHARLQGPSSRVSVSPSQLGPRWE